jgi:hypothetical protein
VSTPALPSVSRPCGPTRRRPLPRAARRGWVVAAFALAAVVLAACQSGGVTVPGDGWSEAQLAQVFDLSELGRELTIAPEGDRLLLDGRTLPPEALAAFPHLTMGRSTNLLRFADDALEAMSPEARAFVLRAAPGELRGRLQGYGLGLDDLRHAWGDHGRLDLSGLIAVAARLDQAPTSAASRLATTGAAMSAGARLLADLGVTR